MSQQLAPLETSNRPTPRASALIEEIRVEGAVSAENRV
jgi:hypothetical protein